MGPDETPPRGAAAAPPAPVRTATALLVAVAVLELAIVVANVVVPVVDAAAASVGDTAGASATGFRAGVWIGAVLRLALVALHVVMALAVRSGRTWPRTVTIVLAALGVLAVLLGAVGAAVSTSTGGSALPWAVVALQLLALAAQVAVVVLLLRAASRRWLAERGAGRRLATPRPARA